ncbi:LytTR family DNA-binding domain-containing protein [Peptostreptococcus porci]|uniref:LytTR family DNA-binding domain-containing protein n=1 Tax=Peptostreptococcus porci TaxID=2652282 RepID=UPI0023F5868A|nr:LytTR family DNA-binding domain-containing protein [Peptostreptococcus porci]MDD7183977.1 LytTR family DNA-binding domain-containing protein [Peptostreptococcus porci]MDY4128012.1 LytTR family DNA-binding domain-containing protein [Peptostreptococcus porci]MDY5436332.1 LytTR family DNA-binding domain-containing protein [Peptostreptococcus porci]
MEIEIKIDNKCSDTKVVIITNKITDEVDYIINTISNHSHRRIVGVENEKITILEPTEIVRIYSSSGKVFACCASKEYTLKLRLYELEEILDQNNFVRISNSEIVNLKKVDKFDIRFNGTICIIFLDGTITYASRRYVKKIKTILGI